LKIYGVFSTVYFLLSFFSFRLLFVNSNIFRLSRGLKKRVEDAELAELLKKWYG